MYKGKYHYLYGGSDMSNLYNDDQYDQNSEKINDGNNKMDQDYQESKEACEQESATQIPADAQKEEGVASQEGAFEEKKDTDEKQSDSLTEESPKCSCSYTPPYYVPNFTQSGEVSAAVPESKKKGIPIWVPILVAACLIISFVIGGFSGYFFSRYRILKAPGGLKNGVTIIKNDGSIKVNEQNGSTGYSNLSVSEVVDLVADSVVEITTSHVQTDFFYQSYIVSGAGSGVIVGEDSENGASYIITNHHVIENSESIVVRLTTGDEFEAEVVGSDAETDIAILRISALGLTHAILGKSENLQVGEEVVAIGNPLGELGGTVTDGIISALDRKVVIDGHRMTLLQTNTAINPGNSGGGLFNMAGELIGIVNAKQAETGIEGLGFAIPIDVAYDVAKDLMDYGYVVGRLNLGFAVVEKPNQFLVNNIYTFKPGIYVSSSQHKNLEEYDRILSVNGKEIRQMSDFYHEIDRLQDGDTLTLVVSRMVNFRGTFTEVRVDVPISFTKAPR